MAFGKTDTIEKLREMVPNPETSFVWLRPTYKESRKSTNCAEDVSIRTGIGTRDKKTNAVTSEVYCFTFRNDVGLKLNEEYVEIAIYENRMYFRPTKDKHLGYKIRSYSCKDPSKCNGNTKIKKNEENKELLDKFIGDYKLEYDKVYKLYYIEIPEK